MKILVYPHDLTMGGSQLNAIEIAAGVRDLGHEVSVFGVPGPLTARIRDLGLEFVAAPAAGTRPSPSVIRSLRHLIATREIDILHGYEWPPVIDMCWAAHGTRAVAVATVMSMSVAPFIPRGIPTVVGTEDIAATERARGRLDVAVIEPPVDLSSNRPDLGLDPLAFRRAVGADPDSILVVSVGRLAHELKLEGLLTAIEVIPQLRYDVQLVLVGDGPARDLVADAAARANARAGRRAVLLTGQLDDPRPAYAAANVVIGMGGSALRALSFGAPLVVQGEGGFWELLTPATVDQFLWSGWFGLGTNGDDGARQLSVAIGPVLADASLRRELGTFGLDLVRRRFSLDGAASRQLACYETALATPRPQPVAFREAIRSSSVYVGHALRRKWRRRRGGLPTDDFNSNLARTRTTSPTGHGPVAAQDMKEHQIR